MPAPWGVTTTGFNKKILDDLITEIEDAERADIDPALNLGPDSVFGQLNGIIGDKLRELWDLGEAIYRALYPDSATGDALENVASINGVFKQAATKSTVTVTITGTPATNIPIGRVISVAGTGDRFVTLATVVIGGGGTVDVACEAEETGPVAAPAGTLTVIETPVGGWASVTNPLDAELGTNEEGDAALRVRRLEILFNPGAGTLESILAGVSEVVDVVDVFAFENTSMITNGDGVPAKSFEIVVEGGTDAAIAAAIFTKKPAGILAFGTTTVAVADSQAINHDISFSRPVDVPIYVSLTVAVIPSVFGGGNEAEGIAQVEAAVVAEGDALGIGDDVIALKIKCSPLDGVPGVVDVTVFTIGTAPAPVGIINIPLTNRQVSTFDTSNVVVTVVLAT